VDDLLAFARMLLRGGGQVLTADQVREMSRDHLTAQQREVAAAFLGGRGWGLGTSVVLDGPWAGVIGWDGGLGTSFLVHPARDLVVIVLTPAAVRDRAGTRCPHRRASRRPRRGRVTVAQLAAPSCARFGHRRRALTAVPRHDQPQDQATADLAAAGAPCSADVATLG
jgi:CubicO group peptidase (beta-lactamase class C family)